jgi:two-component system, OmpR family, phosphate regulon sensor histidine kinase PhoR
VVRSSSVLIAFSVAMLLAGIALAAPELYDRMPSIGEPSFVNVAAAILVLLGAISGLLAHRHMRSTCHRLAAVISERLRTGSDEPIPASDRALKPLTQAANQMLMSVQAQLNEAKRKVRELEIQLKVVQLEREHAESILHSISDAVLVTDPWDDLVLANESAARALNFKIANEGRQPIDQMLRDQKLISLIREMRASRSSGGRKVVEHQIHTGGEDRTFKVTLSCLAGDRQDGSGVVAVLHDVTREAEVAQMKNDFVSHVSHELRTPLASIRAYVEMLIDGEATDAKQQAEFYEVIQNEANRLGRLIDNILDISRIESGVVKINKQPLSVTVVIKEALEIITPQASGKQIKVKENIAPAIYQSLADKDMIHRAILNLMSNAVKYTPEGGTLSVSTEVDETAKRITVKISDTGVGIPPKDLPYVFDKFYRVEANNRMAKGTGLGLSLVKHIVETVHHGRVFVESTVGEGSTFGIELSLC